MAVDLINDENFLVRIDARLRERHSMPSRVTQFPVEGGGTISDHIYNEPEKLSVEGFVSDTPVVSIFSLLSSGPLPSLFQQPNLSLAGAALDQLEGLRAARTPMTVVTGLRRYTDMAIENIDVPREAATGKALQFTIDFVRIRTVSVETTTIPREKIQPGKPQDQAAGATDTGKQPAAPIPEAERASLLRQAGSKISEVVYDMLNSEVPLGAAP